MVSNPFSVSNHQPLRYFGDEFLDLESFLAKINNHYIKLIYAEEVNFKVMWYNQIGSAGYKQYIRDTIKAWAEAKNHFNRTGKLPTLDKEPESQGEHYK